MPDVGDLVEVILAPVIIYFLDFTVGLHFVASILLQMKSLCFSRFNKLTHKQGKPLSGLLLCNKRCYVCFMTEGFVPTTQSVKNPDLSG